MRSHVLSGRHHRVATSRDLDVNTRLGDGNLGPCSSARFLHGVEILGRLIHRFPLWNIDLVDVVSGAAACTAGGSDATLNAFNKLARTWVDFCKGIMITRLPSPAHVWPTHRWVGGRACLLSGTDWDPVASVFKLWGFQGRHALLETSVHGRVHGNVLVAKDHRGDIRLLGIL